MVQLGCAHIWMCTLKSQMGCILCHLMQFTCHVCMFVLPPSRFFSIKHNIHSICNVLIKIIIKVQFYMSNVDIKLQNKESKNYTLTFNWMDHKWHLYISSWLTDWDALGLEMVKSHGHISTYTMQMRGRGCCCTLSMIYGLVTFVKLLYKWQLLVSLNKTHTQKKTENKKHGPIKLVTCTHN